MKQLFTDLQEAQRLLDRDQPSPPEGEGLVPFLQLLHALAEPRKGVPFPEQSL